MDTARLVLDYLAVLRWPVVTIFLVVVFRAQLRVMLRRVTEVGGPGFNAKFSEQVEEIFRDQAAVGPMVTATHAHNVMPAKRFEYDGDYADLLGAAAPYLDGQVVELSLSDIDSGLHGVMFAMGLARGTGGKVAFDEKAPNTLFLLPPAFSMGGPAD